MPEPHPFGQLPELETERLRLRKLTLDDAQDMFQYASDPQVTQFTTWDTHKSVEDSIDFITLVLQEYDNADSGWTWAIELKENGKLIGTIGITWSHPEHRRAEIGYAIGRPHWGKGLTTEAAREVIRYGFERMGLNRIEARCVPENVASARVMEKAGMTYEGILREQMFVKGKYDDLKMYSMLKREFDGR